MEYPRTNLRYYLEGLSKTMKNFSQDIQRSGHVSSSLVTYMLCLDDLGGWKQGGASCNLRLWSYGSRITYKAEHQFVNGEEN